MRARRSVQCVYSSPRSCWRTDSIIFAAKQIDFRSCQCHVWWTCQLSELQAKEEGGRSGSWSSVGRRIVNFEETGNHTMWKPILNRYFVKSIKTRAFCSKNRFSYYTRVLGHLKAGYPDFKNRDPIPSLVPKFSNLRAPLAFDPWFCLKLSISVQYVCMFRYLGASRLNGRGEGPSGFIQKIGLIGGNGRHNWTGTNLVDHIYEEHTGAPPCSLVPCTTGVEAGNRFPKMPVIQGQGWAAGMHEEWKGKVQAASQTARETPMMNVLLGEGLNCFLGLFYAWRMCFITSSLL